ncbi:alkaline phosphatase family protein [Streptosporangium sp. NPDC000396]|uniref:alkaline phosphatase family protein n=1 Tax=Streptosporangium sp. NPDC000396 TaxID=3366185 RepID=UPI003698A52C
MKPPPRPKVLVVGVDGVRPDRLLAARVPHFRRLMEAGTFATGYLKVLKTGYLRLLKNGRRKVMKSVRSSSGPGWTTVLTGVGPDKHGVHNNSFKGSKFKKYPDFLTRLERIRPSLNTAAVTSWRLLPKTGAVGPRVDLRTTSRDRRYGAGVKDDLVVGRMSDLLRTTQIDVGFVHLDSTDAVAHRKGALGRDYLRAIELMDSRLGRLFDAIRARPIFPAEKWTIIIVTDHGHRDEGGHGGESLKERGIFLLAAGPGIARGVRRRDARQVDVAATVFAQLGIPLPKGLDGKPIGTAAPEK